MAGTSEHSLSTRTLRGMFWAYGSYVGGRLLVLLSTAVLARLLDPDDFGVVALATLFMTLLDTISDLGVSQALVIVPDDEVEDRANTVFSFSVALGAVLTLVTALAAPLAALFFHQPELTGLLAVLGTNFLIRSFGTTHYALAQKRLDFRARTAAEFADVVIRGGTGIALALAGFGAWSLVLGYVIGAAALTVTINILSPFRPHPLRARREHLRSLLRFGGQLTGVDVISAVLGNLDYIFIGRVLGATSLGLYTLGFRLPELIVINLSSVAGHVLFPAFASLEREELAGAYLRSLRYILMVGLPLAAGLALLAKPFVLVAFGDQWGGSVVPMQLLTIFAFGVTVGIPAGTAYKAVGRADVLLKLAAPRAVMVVTLFLLFTSRGINAVAACQAVVAGIFTTVGILLAARLLGVGLRGMLAAAWPPACAAAVLSLVLLVVRAAIGEPLLVLLAGAVLGGAAYIGTLWLVERESVTYLVDTAFPGLARRRAAVSG